jgi:hypothetical protein
VKNDRKLPGWDYDDGDGAALLNAAALLDDIERARIAAENRKRALTLPVEKGGKGLDLLHPAVGTATELLLPVRAAEHAATLELKRQLRRHPLGPWVKRTIGVGEKQGARLLAALGDPYWHPLYDRPRTVSELWAYCGYHVIDGEAARRRRGERINWNPEAKMRAFLVAESCMKQRTSPYRSVYEEHRARHDAAVHSDPCPPCGPAGHPALAGSPLSDGHKYVRALRATAKAVLRDLWREARELHQSHDRSGTQPPRALVQSDNEARRAS